MEDEESMMCCGIQGVCVENVGGVVYGMRFHRLKPIWSITIQSQIASDANPLIHYSLLSLVSMGKVMIRLVCDVSF